jgi:hypothetical protein
MKKMKKILIILTAMLLFNSCDKGFEDMNVDPTKPSQISASTKFSYAQLYTEGEWYGSYLFYNVIQLMPNVQQINITSYHPIFTYKEGKNIHFFFEAQYAHTIKTLVDLEHQLKESNSATKDVDLALVKVQKVLAFSRLTDVFGDIPYSEAGLGSIEGIRQPKYDTQADIYDDMLHSLEDAVATLDNGGNTSFGNADLMYAGDLGKWKKFANSLMLRLAMRMVKIDEPKARTWAEKAINGGVMTGNEDIAYLQMENNSNDQGPNVNQLTKCFSSRHPNQIKISKTFFDFLNNNNDPRLSVLCSTVDGNTDPGLQSGQDINDFNRGAANSKPNINIFGGSGNIIYDAPFFFQTYAEVEFMLAEAAYRWGFAGGNTATETHYNAGVTAAMQYLSMYGHGVDIPQSEIDAYLAANPFDTNNALKMINEQYWVATFGNGIESFSNWRRSGYPELVPMDVANNLTGGEIPRRFIYPGSEKLNNSEELQKAIDRLAGGDHNTSRVWWDAL